MTDRVDLTVSIADYHVADELRDCLGSVVESALRHRLEGHRRGQRKRRTDAGDPR